MVTPQLVDTHCHLYADEFAPDRPAAVKRAIDAGVSRIYLPNVDRDSVEAMLLLERDFPGTCFAMMGLHPCYVKANYAETLREFREMISKRTFAAVGEIGLDFYWDLSFKEQQYEAFRQQLGWGLEFNLPVVIHSRESLRQCIDVVRETGNGTIRGIFHCFGGTEQEAGEIRDLGMYIGIGGVVTYKKSGLAELLQKIGLDRVVLETDAPYLSPVPFRGKRNEPAYLVHIIQRIEEATGISKEKIAAITTRNAQDIFG